LIICFGRSGNNVAAFLKDLERGQAKKFIPPPPSRIFGSHRFRIGRSLNWPDYTTASIQFSRGCPYDCDFCCVHEMLAGNAREKFLADYRRA